MKATLKVKLERTPNHIRGDDYALVFIIKFKEKGKIFSTSVRKKIMKYEVFYGGEVAYPRLLKFKDITSMDSLLGRSIELLRNKGLVVDIAKSIVQTYLEEYLTNKSSYELEIALKQVMKDLNKTKIKFDVDLGDDE